MGVDVSSGRLSWFRELIPVDFDKSTLLLIPIIIYQIGYFIVPFIILIRISLYEPISGEAYAKNTLSILSYQQLLASEFIHKVFFTTVKMAFIATILTVISGTFYAYVTWRSEGVVKMGLLAAMALPLLTTLVVKLYSWMLLLAPDGLITGAANTIMVGANPLQLVANQFGVVVGLVYTTLPYASLSVYGVLDSLNEDVLDAARDLGASRPRSVIEVVIPHAMPGIIVASVITLTWNFGAYAAPNLLGSASERTLAIEASYQLFQQFNWANAAALSIIMLLIVIALVAALFVVLGQWGGEIHGST